MDRNLWRLCDDWSNGGNPSIFVIKNKDVAKGFLNYFEGLWKISKKA